jgi:hypothetical protein
VIKDNTAARVRVQKKATCWQCRLQEAALQKCSVCRTAFYCGEICQTAHWKTHHKHVCKELAESRRANLREGSVIR